MVEPFQKMGEEFQKVGKDSYDAAVRSFGELNKGLQDIAVEMTDFSKKVFDESTRTFEQLMGVRSVDQAIEIQSHYVSRAYDAYMTEMSKLGEMYVGLARTAYRPIGATLAKQKA
jgi:hypothetical protein